MTDLPHILAPPGACDCHIHIYGDPERFSFQPMPGREPPQDYLSDYLAVRDRLKLTRTVIIQSPFYGTDNTCMLDAIASLGPNALGIAVVSSDVTDAELQELHEGGVRGLRFGIELHKGMRPTELLEEMAARIEPLGWHIQYRSTERDLPDIAQRLALLPVPVCIDHIGSIPPETGIDHPAFGALLRLLDTGRCWIKLSAPYQLSQFGPPDYADYRPQAQALASAAPERMLWGTNWPHPRVDRKPDDVHLLDVLSDWVPNIEQRNAILVDNPESFYGFPPTEQAKEWPKF